MTTSDPDPNIQARRRRQGASSGPQSAERAEMPSRREQRGGGGGGSFGGGGGGTGGKKLPVGVVILLIIAYGIYSLFFSNSSNSPSDSGSQEQPPLAAQDTAEPLQPTQPELTPTAPKPDATRAAAASGSGQTWTVLLYQDADDQVLEQDILMDLNEAERVGSSQRVQILSQIDRYKGAYSGDGNWTSTRRYHITQDDDLQSLHSELVQDLGEQDMADGAILADFIAWGVKTYPADKYVLILSDHGMGWPGGFSDADPAVRDPSRAPLTSALSSDQLYLMELDKTLAGVAQDLPGGKFDLIGLDACLMGHLEVASALEPYARYAVLSQETEPALGWAYTSFLQALSDTPEMSAGELSKEVVSSYIRGDQRINDPQARADFLRQGSPMGGLFGQASQISAASLGQQLERDVTLTAIDLAAVPDLIKSLNALSFDLQGENQQKVASARTYAPAFTNVFGKDNPSPYIDLGSFAQLLKRNGVSAKTAQAIDQLLASLQDAVLAEKHGSDKSGATGISIYFPTSALYRSPVAGPQSYTVIARRFATLSLWDDFLAFHYNSVDFKPDVTVPALPKAGAPSRAPGQGQIQVSPISLSAKSAAPGSPVRLTAKVSGKNIGYIYFFVGFYDPKSNSIFKADTDYLESPTSQQLNQLFYPQWNGEKPFNLQLDWEPTVFQITDGSRTSVALFNPQTYGGDAGQAVYTVDGIYHYADGASRPARLYFRDGVMRQVFGFNDAGETGGAREIIPQAGDTFTILEQWLDLDANGQVSQTSTQEGTELTFGAQPFRWKEAFTGAGSYVVGFVVEDMDGNRQEVYTTVEVK